MLNLQTNIDITNLSNFKTKSFTKYYFEINGKLKEIFDFAGKECFYLLLIHVKL